jgi:hypothetical protein
MNEEQQQFFDKLKVAVAGLFDVTPEHLTGAGRFRNDQRQFSEAFELFLYFIYEHYNHSRSVNPLGNYSVALNLSNSTIISNAWSKLHKDRKFSTRLATQIRKVERELSAVHA